MSRAQSVYAHSPVWAQNAMASLQGGRFRLSRTNDAVIRLELRRLLDSERLSHDERRKRLSNELGEFVRVAVSSTPYYREMHARGEFPEIWLADDPLGLIRELPLLEKARVRGHESDFYSTAVAGQRVTYGHTSGTTGSPMKTKETVLSMSRRAAFGARLRSWAGLEEVLHPRRAQFTGRQVSQDAPPFWRRNVFDNSLLLSTVNIDERSAILYADRIMAFAPQLMDGYPSAMLALARIADAQAIDLPQVGTIIATAETLTISARREIEEGFRGRVFNQYAATEPSCFWSDCEYGRMHIHEEYGVSEILDPKGLPAKPGELGEVVVTSVLNPAMPLIRYRTGDLARVAAEAVCECGRDLPLVAEVLGRRDDTLYFPGRGFVGRLDPVYKGLVGILESQIVQETLTSVRVLIVHTDDFDHEQRALLVSNIRSKIGDGPTIELERVDAIPRGRNGKFRTVVSECSGDYPVDLGYGDAPLASDASPSSL